MKWKFQNGVCAICNQININGRKLSVDHNHKTGKFRGLLCLKCNLAIGYLQEDVSLFEKSIEYLKKYQEASCEE